MKKGNLFQKLYKGMKALDRNHKNFNEEDALHWKDEPMEELNLLLKDIKERLKLISNANSSHAEILILKMVKFFTDFI